jgi:hypothetical protein
MMVNAMLGPGREAALGVIEAFEGLHDMTL